MLLTGHHATPVVILFFSLINVTCIALHHTTPMLHVLVIRHSTSVTYGTTCHVSHVNGHFVIYRER